MPSPCPECGFDGRGLSPADAVVALRSLPRRFDAAAAQPEEAQPEEDGPGAAGQDATDDADRSAAAVAAAGQAADAIAALAADLRRVLVEDDPALETGGNEATGIRNGGDPATAMTRLQAATGALADLAAAQPAEVWTRSGVRSGGPVSAADLLREAVHAGIHRLRSVADS